MENATSTTADNFFDDKGIEMPSNLSTRRKRWASLLVVVLCSGFAGGPIASFPTLEPILIGEGVFAGPDQQLKLTSIYTLAMSLTMISQLCSGILYDAVGPRALASWSAFLILLCQAVMAISIKFQFLNPLLWVAYPLATALGYMNNMGGYAWLYLLPGEQSSVASITGCIQLLSDSFVLVAVFLHNEFHVGIPVYFSICACLSGITGIVCLWFIPPHKFNKEVTAIVQRSMRNVDVESNSYGATQDPIQVDEADAESLWQILTRTAASWRDAFKCMVGLYPCAFLIPLFIGAPSGYMFAVFPQTVMFPFYEGFLGKADATTLVDIWGGLYPCTAACFVLLLGRSVHSFGYVRNLMGLMVICFLNMVFFCVPQFGAQVAGQVTLACQSNAWYVLQPMFVLSYAPPELFGTIFGFFGFVCGVLQIILSPLAIFVVRSIYEAVTGRHESVTWTLLTTIGLWYVVSLLSNAMMFVYWAFYPMPSSGGTTMADVRNAWRSNDKKGFETGADIRNAFGNMSKAGIETHPLKLASDETFPLQPASDRPQVPPSSRAPTCLTPCLSGSWVCAKRSGS